MSNQRHEFKKRLSIAIERRDDLVRKRAELERELARQSRAITALAGAVGDEPPRLGLTDAVLLVVRTADEPLAATEIRDELREIGHDISHFSNPMASLHQVLIRLEQKKEIAEVPTSDHRRRFAAKGGPWQNSPIYDKPFGAPNSAANTFLKKPASTDVRGRRASAPKKLITKKN